MIINFDKRGGGSSDGYTKAQVDEIVSAATQDAISSANTYTDELNSKFDESEEVISRSLNDLDDRIEVNANDIADLQSEKADRSEITPIPDNISYFNNDAGYITQTEVEAEGYVTESDINASGYTTSGWVQSQGYATQSDISSAISAAEALIIANFVASSDIRNIVRISQSDYDAMSAHSSTTLYLIG